MKIHLNFGGEFELFKLETLLTWVVSHFGCMNNFNDLSEFFVLAEVFSVFKLILQSLHSIHSSKLFFFCFDEAMHLTLNSMNIIIMLRSVFCEQFIVFFVEYFAYFANNFANLLCLGFITIHSIQQCFDLCQKWCF